MPLRASNSVILCAVPLAGNLNPASSASEPPRGVQVQVKGAPGPLVRSMARAALSAARPSPAQRRGLPPSSGGGKATVGALAASLSPGSAQPEGADTWSPSESPSRPSESPISSFPGPGRGPGRDPRPDPRFAESLSRRVAGPGPVALMLVSSGSTRSAKVLALRLASRARRRAAERARAPRAKARLLAVRRSSLRPQSPLQAAVTVRAAARASHSQ